MNAGVCVGGLFNETDLEDELNMIELNCNGTVQLTKLVVSQMTGLGAGRILCTASVAGEMVAPREAVYAAIKYELKDIGITVTALQPGPTATDFFHRAGMDDTEVGQKGKSKVSRMR